MGVTVVKARKKLPSALFTICNVYINLNNVSLGHRKNCHQQKVTNDRREGHSNQCQGEPGSPGLCSFRQPASQEGVPASTQLPGALSALSPSKFSLLFPTSGEHRCRSHSTHPMPSLGRAPNNPLPIVQESGNTQARDDMRLQKQTFAKTPAMHRGSPTTLCCPPGSGKMILSVHLPGLYLQGPGWPQSPQATCPQ